MDWITHIITFLLGLALVGRFGLCTRRASKLAIQLKIRTIIM